MKPFILISFYLCIAYNAFAQAPKFSNDFLNVGVGARGLSMGAAVTSNSSSIYSAYWNPAALTSVPVNFQVGAQHAQWFAGIGNYDYAGFGKKLDAEGKSFGSISLIRMGIDDIPNTLLLRAPDGSIDYSRLKSFSVADYAMLVSYARKLGLSPWSIGVNAKLIHRSFGSFAKAWGFGFDLSAYYQKNRFSFGVIGRDITTSFNAYNFSFSDEEKAGLQLSGNDIPTSSVEYTLPKLVLGISYTIPFNTQWALLPSLDMEFSGNSTESSILSSEKFIADPRIGFELNYAQKVYLRIGFNNFQREISDTDPSKKNFLFQPNGGLGLKFKRIGLDYALTNIGTLGAGLYSHYFSLSLDF